MSPRRRELSASAAAHIEGWICSLQIDSVSLSADEDGVISIDEIVFAPHNGGKYRLALALGPEEGDALQLYQAPDGDVNDLTIRPATVESWYGEASA